MPKQEGQKSKLVTLLRILEQRMPICQSFSSRRYTITVFFSFLLSMKA